MNETVLRFAELSFSQRNEDGSIEMNELAIPPRRRYWIGILAAVGALLLLLAGGWYLLVYGNALTVHIALEGEETLTLELGEDYREAGVKAEVRGTRFWQEGFVPEELTITTDGAIPRPALEKQRRHSGLCLSSIPRAL